METKFSDLEGRILTAVQVNNDENEITFTTTDGKQFMLSHWQNCCECVYIDAVIGDLDDLLNTPILLAEERSSTDEGPMPVGDRILTLARQSEYDESFTWTFYALRTIKGSVDIRWYGSSNGYYSESVNFEQINQQEVSEECTPFTT